MPIYLHEFLFKKKDKDKPFPRSKYDEIKAKYKTKKSLPDWNSIDIAAYYICKYTTSDLDKFCNSKDAQITIKDLQKRIQSDDPNYITAEDKRLVDKFIKGAKSGVLIIHNDHNLGDTSVIYNKGTKSFWYPNNDEVAYAEDNLEYFIMSTVYDKILYEHGYYMDKIDEET